MALTPVKNEPTVEEIKATLMELRPLPVGRQEFDVFADRIHSGTGLPNTLESTKFALAEMIMHLDPTMDFQTDAYFIKKLRKGAANQVAVAVMEEVRAAAKARLKAEEEAKKQLTQGEVTAATSKDAAVDGAKTQVL